MNPNSNSNAWRAAGLTRPRRGINFGNFLESAFEGKDTEGLIIQDDWFPLLKDAGFDFIRLPVRWSAHAAQSAPFAVEDAFLARVAHLVDVALAAGLTIIVNHHHYTGLIEDPAGQRERFLALWHIVAARFRGYPDGLFLEILNEPTGNLTAPLWNDYLKQAHAAIRSEDQSRALIVGPHDWNNITGLDTLSLAGLELDHRLIVTFHYYEPHPFTHQGAPWVTPPHPIGLHWTGSASELAVLRADLDRALAWGEQAGRPLLLGEFGAYQPCVPEDEAVCWIASIREEAERREIPWCFWEFCHSFGIWDRHKKVFKERFLRALVP
jgi:endoglucanase